MEYDGSGRLTADEITRAYGERIVAGSSQLMDKPGGGFREVFPTFLTKRYYGAYNWQTATYELRTRTGNRLVQPRARGTRAGRS